MKIIWETIIKDATSFSQMTTASFQRMMGKATDILTEAVTIAGKMEAKRAYFPMAADTTEGLTEVRDIYFLMAHDIFTDPTAAAEPYSPMEADITIKPMEAGGGNTKMEVDITRKQMEAAQTMMPALWMMNLQTWKNPTEKMRSRTVQLQK
ncbi:hypothetical protein [Eubacterium ramulus]|jgi:hypothetical protein|uniref:hypothetical protein n=1 Tax=Eubacterium ramulus TaxID=39490 RepID=UPI0035225A2C